MKKYINYSYYYAKKIYSATIQSILLSFLIVLSAFTAHASSQVQSTPSSDITINNVQNANLKKVNGFENLGKFHAWEAFSMITTDEVVCWVSSESTLDKTLEENNKLSSLMLSIRLENKERDEFSYHSRYNLEEQTKVRLTIDNLVGFNLSPQGHWAWLKSSIDESRFVLASQKGTRLILSGTTTKDNRFSETYSLSGFTAAYKVAFDACQKELEKKESNN